MTKHALNELVSDVISGEWGNDPTESSFIKVIRTTNFTNDGKINYSKEIVTRDIELKKYEKKKLKNGDVIIEKSGGSPTQPVGRVVLFDLNEEGYVCNNFTSIVRPKSNVDGRYLLYGMYYLHLTGRTLTYQNKTTGIINLKLDNYLKSESIYVPDMIVQKKIASALMEADALIQKRKAAIAKLDGLVESVFIEMFGEPVSNSKKLKQVAFGEVCELKLGKMLDAKKIDGKNLFPYLGNRNVRWGHFDLIDLKEMDFNDKDQLTFSLQNGDLLICEGGEIGRAAIWKWDDKKIYYQKALHRARIKDDLATSEYLLYILWFFSKNNGFKDYQSSVTIAHLTAEKLKSMLIPLAPMQLQITFSRIYSQISQEKELMETSLRKLDENFQSLLHQAFTGRLQFRDSKVDDYALKR